jgi:hypothetical protein
MQWLDNENKNRITKTGGKKSLRLLGLKRPTSSFSYSWDLKGSD